MITGKSIALAELIDAGGGKVKPKDLIKGLNAESAGAFPYTANYSEEITEVTRDVTTHTHLMEQTSDRLAEIIRGAMGNIRDYGVPLAKHLADKANMIYSKRELQNLVYNQFNISYANVNDSFLDSGLYPKEVKNNTFSYEGIDLNFMSRLSFEHADAQDVEKFIGSNHPDLVSVLSCTDTSLSDIAWMVGDLEALKSLFANQNGVFNFTQVKNLDTNRLLKIYILLTKMYSSEDPVPWLKGGSLQEYRQLVNLLWNGVTAYLINLKQVLRAYAAHGLILQVERDVRLGDRREEMFRGPRYLVGSVRVFYTDEVLAKFEQAGMGFDEAVMGYYWSNLTGTRLTIPELLQDPQKAKQACANYYDAVGKVMVEKGRAIFVASAANAVCEFILSRPPLKERVQSIIGGSGEMIDSWVHRHFNGELERCYYACFHENHRSGNYVVESSESGRSITDCILETNLVPMFLRALKCDMAAQIIENTFVTVEGEDHIADKRQRLHVGLIDLIVKHSVEKA